MTIDLSYPIVLRNDAEALHQTTVRNDAAIVDNSFDIFDIYFLAGFTRGEEKVWAECAAAELIDRPAIIEQMIERQPAIRLAFLLDDLVTSLMEHEVRTHLRSEEHTSELQSLMRISYAVFCLKKNITVTTTIPQLIIYN